MSERDAYKKLVDDANIGADFRTFATSNIGAYLIKRAEREEIETLRKLARVPADDKDHIYKLQLQAQVPKKLLQFISEAIVAGDGAQWSIDQSQE